MESTNHHNTFQTFTITQAFLGAPLQFVPALGSQELEQLVDAYVPGAGTKSEKLSEVTIDFYNNATVDLNTGALVRSYNVYAAFEQSPTQSHSSGFSPSALYAPSPASSAILGDSGYGSTSFGMTPPNRIVGGRVAKKAKKETKKVAESRLPGFSIMTKDGVDVTSTAGRGTKTKEQREHAHLMRIMKACDACKRKKIRCDPSHRQSANEMSRTNSTSTTTTSSRTSPPTSSSRPNPSPPSAPSFSSASCSQNTILSFDAIDDFVLFPEDSLSWTNADLGLSEETDMSHFNFDISQVNDFSHISQPFDNFAPSNYLQSSSDFQLNDYSFDDFLQPDPWSIDPSCLLVSHTRPHLSVTTQDSSCGSRSQLSSCFYGDGPIVRLKTTVSSNGSSFSEGVNTPASSMLQTPVSLCRTNSSCSSQGSTSLDETNSFYNTGLLQQGVSQGLAASLESASSGESGSVHSSDLQEQGVHRSSTVSQESGLLDEHGSFYSSSVQRQGLSHSPNVVQVSSSLDESSSLTSSGFQQKPNYHSPVLSTISISNKPQPDVEEGADFAGICKEAKRVVSEAVLQQHQLPALSSSLGMAQVIDGSLSSSESILQLQTSDLIARANISRGEKIQSTRTSDKAIVSANINYHVDATSPQTSMLDGSLKHDQDTTKYKYNQLGY